MYYHHLVHIRNMKFPQKNPLPVCHGFSDSYYCPHVYLVNLLDIMLCYNIGLPPLNDDYEKITLVCYHYLMVLHTNSQVL